MCEIAVVNGGVNDECEVYAISGEPDDETEGPEEEDYGDIVRQYEGNEEIVARYVEEWERNGKQFAQI